MTGPMDRASAALVLFLLPFMAAGAGAYLGAYLRKKGENLATHEDIEKLNDQVRVVTTTAEKIEAKISGELWNRQKRWELKREVLFEASRSLAAIDEAIIALDSMLQVERKPDELGWHDIDAEQREKWRRASARFDEAKMLVDMVCERETSQAFGKFRMLATDIAQAVIKDKDAAFRSKSSVELSLSLIAARAAVRKELGIDPPAES
jgi:hypothetical protein